MPTVEFSSLKDDLARRDFTINAMAISINDNNFGKMIDPFGGEKDLVSKHIKVMHDKSFIDDPTRMFRAVRFEKRFGFAIEGRTLRLIKDAVKKEMPGKVSRGRVKKELDLIDMEKNRLNMLNRLEELNLWRYAAL
jgi:tRNA nucleotidyltransferase (CCA-adding enzyme)